MGALTVGVVTLPFAFEGQRRRRTALEALDRLQPALDSIIVDLKRSPAATAPATTGIAESFRMADETLNQGIHGIADLILTPGLINLDFADVNTVMQHSGPALMAMGTAGGENRAIKADRAGHLQPVARLVDRRVRAASC